MRFLLAALALWLAYQPALAATQAAAHVAVASNFRPAMQLLSERFTASSGQRLSLSYASTGKLFAQIKQGAPYDLFLAADTLRPELLEQQEYAVKNSRFTYAIGRLVFWEPEAEAKTCNLNRLHDLGNRHLAIANPKLAPYGQAARALLETKGFWQQIQPGVVRGENVNQAFLFVHSGHAAMGFVSYAQLKQRDLLDKGCVWLAPEELHPSIIQQAVLITENQVAQDFVAFLRQPKTQTLLKSLGYQLP